MARKMKTKDELLKGVDPDWVLTDEELGRVEEKIKSANCRGLREVRIEWTYRSPEPTAYIPTVLAALEACRA